MAEYRKGQPGEHLRVELRDQMIEALKSTILDVETGALEPAADKFDRHDRHRFLHNCVVCRGDVAAIIDAVLATIDAHPVLEIRPYYPTQWAYDQACKALEKHRQRADEAEVDAKQWHNTYQQMVNGTDEFLGDLLELLPDAEDTGMDAWDQIPRAVEALRGERDRVKALADRYARASGSDRLAQVMRAVAAEIQAAIGGKPSPALDRSDVARRVHTTSGLAREINDGLRDEPEIPDAS
jgi:hypothetical protein